MDAARNRRQHLLLLLLRLLGERCVERPPPDEKARHSCRRLLSGVAERAQHEVRAVQREREPVIADGECGGVLEHVPRVAVHLRDPVLRVPRLGRSG
jgi:hypothetical protein